MDLVKYKAKLHELRKQTLGVADLVESSAKPVTLDQNSVGRLSRMDAMQGQAMAQASAARQQQLLTGIELALKRVDSGDYGHCLECDEMIAIARLELDLTTEYCIECAHAMETS